MTTVRHMHVQMQLMPARGAERSAPSSTERDAFRATKKRASHAFSVPRSQALFLLLRSLFVASPWISGYDSVMIVGVCRARVNHFLLSACTQRDVLNLTKTRFHCYYCALFSSSSSLDGNVPRRSCSLASSPLREPRLLKSDHVTSTAAFLLIS